MWFIVAAGVILPLLVQAQTSLWIPDVDPQPISAGLLGVGSDGRTTWEVQQGTPSGTFTDPADFGFPGKATLVEGASDAVMTAVLTIEGAPATVAFSCGIQNGVAVCADVLAQGGSFSSDTETETVSSFLVQGGGSGPQSNSGASGVSTTSAPGSAQTTGGSALSAGSSPTSSGAQQTGSTGGSNAAGRHQISYYLFFLGFGASMIHYLL